MQTMTPTIYAWVSFDDWMLLKGSQEARVQPNGTLGLVWLTVNLNAGPTPAGPDGDMIPLQVTDLTGIESWLRVQGEFPMEEWAGFELADGAKPEGWLIARTPVAIVR